MVGPSRLRYLHALQTASCRRTIRYRRLWVVFAYLRDFPTLQDPTRAHTHMFHTFFHKTPIPSTPPPSLLTNKFLLKPSFIKNAVQFLWCPSLFFFLRVTLMAKYKSYSHVRGSRTQENRHIRGPKRVQFSLRVSEFRSIFHVRIDKRCSFEQFLRLWI